MTALAYLFGITAVVLLFAFSHRFWRQATAVAMFLVVLEGALRKWVFPAAQDYLYFAKDLILIAVYLRLIQKGKLDFRTLRRTLGPAGTILLGLSAVWLIVQVANPDGGGLAVGLFGLKAYLMMIPLAAVVPLAFPDRRSLTIFLWAFAALLIPTGLLAVVQFFSGPDALVNRYAWGLETQAVATFGGSRVRVTSTFSYITGYTTYLSVMAPLLVGLLGTAHTTLRQVILFSGFALIGANMFMTGSRAPFVVATGASLVALSTLTWMQNRRAPRIAARILLGAVASYLLVTSAFPTALEAFSARVESSEDMESRSSEYILAFIPLLDWGGLPMTWIGHGTGTAHQGAQHLNPQVGKDLPEGEFPRIGYELGPVGYLLLWLFRAALLLHVYAAARQVKDKDLRPLAHAAVAIMAFNFPGGYVYNPTMQMLVYFLAGVPHVLLTAERARAPGFGAVAEER